MSRTVVGPTTRQWPRVAARWSLAGVLLVAGIAHLGPPRSEFRAQVPPWLPGDVDVVVVVSGLVEILLGAALLVSRRPVVGRVVAGFFVVIFPGNVSQWIEGVDAFGLDSDTARFTRLFFQPVLVVWALWSTSAWPRRRQPSG